MVEDENTENSAGIQRGLKDQKELDMCAQGFEVARFSKLMGSNAANYTAEVEDLYDKMLAKLDSLARLVEKSSARVLEQVSIRKKKKEHIFRCVQAFYVHQFWVFFSILIASATFHSE